MALEILNIPDPVGCDNNACWTEEDGRPQSVAYDTETDSVMCQKCYDNGGFRTPEQVAADAS